MAEIIIKQEALIESWEAWGLNVKGLVGVKKRVVKIKKRI